MSFKNFAAVVAAALTSTIVVSAFAQAPAPATPKPVASPATPKKATTSKKSTTKTSTASTTKKQQPRDAQGHYVKASPSPRMPPSPRPFSTVSPTPKTARTHAISVASETRSRMTTQASPAAMNGTVA